MKNVIKLMAAIIAITTGTPSKGATTLVTLTADRWQGSPPYGENSYPYEWVIQTQSSPGFTPGQEYAGLFSGEVNGQRYLFMCTQLNAQLYMGQTYTYMMNSGMDYINTPFESNGVPLGVAQKQEIATLFSWLIPGQQVAGFTSESGSQSLIGVEMNQDVITAISRATSGEAAGTQISIWEIGQDPSSSGGLIDPGTGVLQFTHQDGRPFTSSDVPQIGNISAVPEPQNFVTLSVLLGLGVFARARRHHGKS